jgi:hypothetical protein
LIDAALLSDTPQWPPGPDPIEQLAERAYRIHKRSHELARAEGQQRMTAETIARPQEGVLAPAAARGGLDCYLRMLAGPNPGGRLLEIRFALAGGDMGRVFISARATSKAGGADPPVIGSYRRVCRGCFAL